MDPPTFRTIKVSLSSLKFPFTLRQKIDTQIVKRIEKLFHNGILDQASYPIPADIRDMPSSIDINTKCCITEDISCLHGMHRVAAAKNFIVKNAEKWWYVNVYQGLTNNQREELIRGSIYQAEYPDGVILRGLLKGEDLWAGTVHSTKERVILTLKRQEDVWIALKNLVPFEGFWARQLDIGNLAGLSSIAGVKQELLNYINAIYSFWERLPEGSHDVETIYKLNLLCPQVPVDRIQIHEMYKSNQLFQKIDDQDQREKALQTVLSSKCVMIPTLWSLFANLRYLGEYLSINREFLLTSVT